MLSSPLSRLLALAAIFQATSACLFAQFTYDACTRAISGTLINNGFPYGQILASTPTESLRTNWGVMVSLIPPFDKTQAAFVQEVRGANVEGGMLTKVTIWDKLSSDGTPELRHEFELVLDRNGDFSNAVFGCDDLAANAWFHDGLGGWERWSEPHPVMTNQIKMCRAAQGETVIGGTMTALPLEGPVETGVELADGYRKVKRAVRTVW